MHVVVGSEGFRFSPREWCSLIVCIFWYFKVQDLQAWRVAGRGPQCRYPGSLLDLELERLWVTGSPGKSQEALLARTAGTSGEESDCQRRRRHRRALRFGKVPWRRKWQPSPVLLSGESHGQRSLVGYSPRGHKESDTTEHTVIQP